MHRLTSIDVLSLSVMMLSMVGRVWPFFLMSFHHQMMSKLYICHGSFIYNISRLPESPTKPTKLRREAEIGQVVESKPRSVKSTRPVKVADIFESVHCRRL